MSNKDQTPFDIPDPEAAGWKEDPDRPGYWLWDTEQPVTEAPEDGVQYGRQDASWTEIVHPTVHWDGDSNGISTNAFRAVVGEENVEGVGLYATGMIRVWESAQNSNYLWSGYGGGSITSHIQADGDAKFAGNVDLLGVGRFGRASIGFDTDQIFARSSNDLSVSGAVDLGTDAVKWKDGWFAGTVNATSFVGDGSQLSNLPIAPGLWTEYTGETSSGIEYTGSLPSGDPAAQISTAGWMVLGGGMTCSSLDTRFWKCSAEDSQLVLSNNYLGPVKADGQVGKIIDLGTAGLEWRDVHATGSVKCSETEYVYGNYSMKVNFINPRFTINAGYQSTGGAALSIDNRYDYVSIIGSCQTTAGFMCRTAEADPFGYGFYNGGGWHMSDATWIRASGSKAVYVANTTANAIAAAGDVTAYYSDERLKTKTGEIEDALDKVEAIDCFYYTNNDIAKSLGYEGDDVQVGVSAQSVKAVMPEVVARAPIDTDADGGSISGEDYMTVKYERLVPLLLQSIKELRREVEELKRGNS